MENSTDSTEASFLNVESLTEAVEVCNIYKSFKQAQNGTFLGLTGHEGIPQNFLLNLASWILFVLLFVYLRKRAWNYGRIALMKKEEIKWADMFYEDDELTLRSIISKRAKVPVLIESLDPSHNPSKHVNIATDGSTLRPVDRSHFYENPSILESTDKLQVVGSRSIDGTVDSTSSSDYYLVAEAEEGQPKNLNSPDTKEHMEIKDTGYFSWIKILYKLTDEQYKEKCGQDCVYYLSFLRHLIWLSFFMTLLSMGVILPINLHHSHFNGSFPEFSDTTIIKLEKDYRFLWVHVSVSIFFMILSVIIMRCFSRHLHFTIRRKDISNTILILGVPKENCQEEMLRTHFEESYPESEITEISFAYDISKVKAAEANRLCATSAKLYSLETLRKKGKRPKIRPYIFGSCDCRCFGVCQEIDAIDHYTKEEQKYLDKVETERQLAITHPLGIAFVTFATEKSAEQVVDDYGICGRLRFLYLPMSTYTRQLNSECWSVKYSPVPEDIHWENLSPNTSVWYLKFVSVNIVVVVMIVVFTTPVYLFATFFGPQKMKHKTHNHTHIHQMNQSFNAHSLEADHERREEISEQISVLSNLVKDTLPSVAVCVLGVILVVLVSSSDVIIGFWSKTKGNLSEMIKTFFFLTFMVIILPSLGVTSIMYFIDNEHSPSWSCIFFKENGALFVNYVITSGLIGTGAELMRLPELLLYAFKISFARSTAEIGSIRKSMLWEFPIGISYAYTLLHFAIFTCFSLIYPLVTPFGLMYLVLKYWTDRYNIYFAYAPCKVDKRIHRAAINLVILCMLMLQINLLVYIHFHLGENRIQDVDLEEATDPGIRALQLFTLVIFTVSTALYLGQVCFNICADFSPISHMKKPHLPHINIKAAFHLSSEEKEGDTYYKALQDHRNLKTKLKTSPWGGVESSENSLDIQTSPDTITDVLDQGIFQFSETQPSEAPSYLTKSIQPEETEQIKVTPRRKPYGHYIPPVLRPEFVRLKKMEENLNVINLEEEIK